MSQATERVARAWAARGVEIQVQTFPASTRTAQEAAAALGCEVAQIAKSLVFRCARSDAPLLVIASGPNRVDEARLGAELGLALVKADAEFVRASTGHAIGGVPPLSDSAPIRTVIDETLLALETIWAAAGTPRAVFAITPAELVRVTGGEVLRVT